MDDVRLENKVALVTGASRGVGKGIALALGEAGSVVYVTGRTVAGGKPTTSLPGSVNQTAAEVAALGGKAVALPCDHRDDDAVRAAVERIERDHGRLDVLVNNVWGGYELLHAGRYETFGGPFWEAPLSVWDGMFDAGVRAHFAASAFAVPLMLRAGAGLIVNVSSFAAANPKEVVQLGVAKAATDHLTRLTAEHLRAHGVAVVSLYPGLVRTEGILKWKDYIDLSNSESPSFVGRAVVALAADDDVMARSGQTAVVAELAEEHGFTDEDGTQPRSLRAQYEVVR
ncbi:MAG TPA: SDR family NAD(P)-dependent oxidoreductase [Gaiellaceae bacterium]|jgi:NAD(P)-dependent dehydrogenase (short-subunit alcohol dehydrogenase family)|nr:SDR family NAD(P)-dependent oxidoreductase [Gaiellaceae bacterium]